MFDLIKKLKEPFKEEDIEWRIGRSGKTKDGKIWATCMPYISARAAQDMLDEWIGESNWKVEYQILGGEGINSGIICKLSIKTGSDWVTKEDGADQTDTEAFKGGLSSAFKRACSVWGIGRYLYNLKEEYVTVVEKNSKEARYAKTKEGEVYYWIPPKLPTWALPEVKKPGVSENLLDKLGGHLIHMGKHEGKTLFELDDDQLAHLISDLKKYTLNTTQKTPPAIKELLEIAVIYSNEKHLKQTYKNTTAS